MWNHFLYFSQDPDPFFFDDDDDDDHLFGDVSLFLFAHVRWNSGYFCTLIPRFSLLFDRVVRAEGVQGNRCRRFWALRKRMLERDRHDKFRINEIQPRFLTPDALVKLPASLLKNSNRTCPMIRFAIKCYSRRDSKTQ